MPGELSGRVALVTGGGWNIGRAIALRFAEAGAAVTVCGRREELLEETAEAIRAAGGCALAVRTDVCELDQVEAAVARTAEVHGAPDVVAAIAGGGASYEPLDRVDPAWWAEVVRVNLVGTFHTVRAALPGLRARGSGSILTCTGAGSFFPMLGSHATAYATAKAGLCRFTDQLAVELIDAGIRVNCLQPGMTWSSEALRAIEEEERQSGKPHPDRAHNHTPEQAAQLALWLASDASAPLTGRIVSVDDDWWRDPERVRRVCESHHAYCLRRQEPE